MGTNKTAPFNDPDHGRDAAIIVSCGCRESRGCTTYFGAPPRYSGSGRPEPFNRASLQTFSQNADHRRHIELIPEEDIIETEIYWKLRTRR